MHDIVTESVCMTGRKIYDLHKSGDTAELGKLFSDLLKKELSEWLDPARVR